jgi:serine protease Do
MDNHEYNSSGEYGNEYQQPTNNTMPPQYSDGGFGYGMPPGDFGGQGKPPRRRGRGLFLTAIILVCLFVGGVVTAYVIMPAIDAAEEIRDMAAVTSDDENSAFDVDDDAQNAQQDTTQDDTAQAAPQTTDAPDIGGTAPNIDVANQPIVQIAEQVSPAVVGVTVSANQMTVDNSLAEQEYGYGTGFIISENGYIVTNNHVVSGSDSIKVTMYDGTEYPASIVGADIATDIAIIKIDAANLTVAALGNSDTLKVGETVVAIGNPLGLELAGSVTSGIVSALGRHISSDGHNQEYIQTDAAINPGNSGGPLVNLAGEVIGINTLKSYIAGYDDYGQSISTEGIGFAIPITDAVPIIEQLMTKGSVERPGIGISCLVDVTNYYNPETAPDGVTIADITIDGPADQAGLMPSDIITTADGQEVLTVEELTAIIKSHKVGDKMDITIWRDGTIIEKSVRIGDLNNMG